MLMVLCHLPSLSLIPLHREGLGVHIWLGAENKIVLMEVFFFFFFCGASVLLRYLVLSSPEKPLSCLPASCEAGVF